MYTFETLEPKHFLADGVSYIEFDVLLWGKKSELSILDIDIDNNMNGIEQALLVYIKQLQRNVEWINTNKKLIIQAILDDKILELANEWVENGESVEKDGKIYYIVDDGETETEVEFPISKEQFINSLYIGGINSYMDFNEISFDMFMGTNPDYFATHSIEVFLTFNNVGDCEINVNGLAG